MDTEVVAVGRVERGDDSKGPPYSWTIYFVETPKVIGGGGVILHEAWITVYDDGEWNSFVRAQVDCVNAQYRLRARLRQTNLVELLDLATPFVEHPTGVHRDEQKGNEAHLRYDWHRWDETKNGLFIDGNYY